MSFFKNRTVIGVAELTKQSLVLNRLRTKGYMDSAIFMQKNNEINQQLDLLKRNRRRLLESDADDEMISDCKLLIELMEQGSPYLTAFDEALFHSIVNQIVVTEQDKAIINGQDIPCDDKTKNAVMRASIWNHYRDNLQLAEVEMI